MNHIPALPTEKRQKRDSRSVSFFKNENAKPLNYSNFPRTDKKELAKPGHKHLDESDIHGTFIESARDHTGQVDVHIEDASPLKEQPVEIPIGQEEKGVSSPLVVGQNGEDYENKELIGEEELNEGDETKATEQSRVGMTVFEYMRCFFSKDENLIKKKEMLQEGRTRIEERLDVFNILKKMREIDKLKALLLDKYQLALFDNLPKPILEQESRNILKTRGGSISHLVQGTFVNQTKEAQLKYAYKYIKHKEEKSPLDQRLIEVYEEFSYY